MAKHKFVPHYEKFRDNSCYSYDFSRTCEVYSDVQELGSNGVLVSHSESRTIDVVEDLDNYKLSDFSISNLQAVGAKLTPMSVAPNPIDAIDKATNMISQLDIEVENKPN